MKRIISIFSALLLSAVSFVCLAQGIDFTDARSLTITGQLFPDNPHTYQRIDTDTYTGFDDVEFGQVHQCTGIAIAFKTDSPRIWARVSGFQPRFGGSTGPRGQKGLDLYIKQRDGSWKWGGGCTLSENGKSYPILNNNENGLLECLLYLPLFSEIGTLEVGVKSGYRLEALPSPFRNRIAVFGSSFTHGYGASRPAMTWVAQFSRMTGLQLLNLGCSGHSKLQPYFAHPLADIQADAYIFDGFSNPKPEEIEERLFPFIEIIQAKNPGKPLIFLKTIDRAWEISNAEIRSTMEEKRAMAERMMRKACKKYKDVYFVTTTCASDPERETTVDGTHPGDYGYRLWAESIKEPVLEILSRYGIH